MTAFLYLEHLTDADLDLLARAYGRPASIDFLGDLRARPGYLESVLQEPRVYEALCGADKDSVLLHASPFLIFAILVHRASEDLNRAAFVREWVAPGRRVPVFEVNDLREFANNSLHRLFLAELLSSYTHVASGSFMVRTGRGRRRRRFSELDPIRLIELLDAVPERQRGALYRRLGDLSLFLTGVFPDHTDRVLPSSHRQRLGRMLAHDHEKLSLHDEPATGWGDIRLLEQLGRRSYQLAWRATDTYASGRPTLLSEMAEGFAHARRILNFLTDTYLFPFREQWFPVQ
ncbi:MAG: hypothetical protein NVSMB22_12570 [Chloroflexota bacterium]